MTTGAVVLLSGGQDSTICLAWALRELGRPLVSVTIDYGQRHRKELHAARAVADIIGVDERRIIRLDLGGSIPSGLTEPRAEIEASGGINNLPTTYVPGRNFVFLGLAAGIAQTRGLENIVIGCSEVDSSGYPDCRWPSLSAVTHALRLCLDFPRLQVAAPLLWLSKAESLTLAIDLVDLGCMDALKYSWTCYHGGDRPCGTCPSCVIRAKGFEEAGLPDPAL